MLPAPTGISFNDGADYNSFNLGIVGTEAAKAGVGLGIGAGKAILDNPGAALSATNLTNLSNRGLDFLRTENPLASEAGRNNASIATGTVANPNIASGFASNRIRQFGFSFKMIAQNEFESKHVRAINKIFRRYIYGKKSLGGLQLEYPAIWSIDFFNLQSEATRNPYIPKIASCYLTDLNTTYNSSSDVFYENDAPLEVDTTVTFQETRALSFEDIVAMETDTSVNTLESRTFADTYAARIDSAEAGEIFKDTAVDLIDGAQDLLNGQNQEVVNPEEAAENAALREQGYRGYIPGEDN